MKSEMGNYSVSSVLSISVLSSMEDTIIKCLRVFLWRHFGVLGLCRMTLLHGKLTVGKRATHVVTQSNNWLLQNNV